MRIEATGPTDTRMLQLAYKENEDLRKENKIIRESISVMFESMRRHNKELQDEVRRLTKGLQVSCALDLLKENKRMAAIKDDEVEYGFIVINDDITYRSMLPMLIFKDESLILGNKGIREYLKTLKEATDERSD
jgi:hypothetical protein